MSTSFTAAVILNCVSKALTITKDYLYKHTTFETFFHSGTRTPCLNSFYNVDRVHTITVLKKKFMGYTSQILFNKLIKLSPALNSNQRTEIQNLIEDNAEEVFEGGEQVYSAISCFQSSYKILYLHLFTIEPDFNDHEEAVRVSQMSIETYFDIGGDCFIISSFVKSYFKSHYSESNYMPVHLSMEKAINGCSLLFAPICLGFYKCPPHFFDIVQEFVKACADKPEYLPADYRIPFDLNLYEKMKEYQINGPSPLARSLIPE